MTPDLATLRLFLCRLPSSPPQVVSLLAGAFFATVLLVPSASAQDFTSNVSGNSNCDGTWDDPNCWTLTGSKDNANDIPDTQNESVEIQEDDALQVKTDGFNVGSVDILDSDGNPGDSGIQQLAGGSTLFTINGLLDSAGTLQLDAGLSGEGNVTINGGTLSDGDIIVGSATLTVTGSLSNSSGAELSASSGGIIKIATNFNNDGNLALGGGSEVILNGNGVNTGTSQSLDGDFSGTNNLQDVTVKTDAKVDPADDLTSSNNSPVTVKGTFTVEDGGVYGNDPEDADMQYGGLDFSIVGTGTFFAQQLTYNNSSSSDSNPVLASGEVFSEVVVTNNAYVRVKSNFIINDKLVIATDNEFNLDSGGSLTLNDDFEVNGVYSPGTNSTAFKGGTDTGTGDAGSTSCSGVKTATGDCEQDVFGTGDLQFGPIDVDGTDTRAVISQGEQVASTPTVSTLTIDPGNDESNVQFVLDDSDLEVTGDIINNGSFQAGSKRVSFVGGTTQTLNSPDGFNFQDVRVANTNTSSEAIDISSTTFRVDTLDIESGKIEVNDGDVLQVDGRLRLDGGLDGNSDGEGVALEITGTGRAVLTSNNNQDQEGYIEYVDNDNSGSPDGNLDGTISGTVVKQRQITQKDAFYYLAGPVGTSSNDTFNEFLQTGQGTNDLYTMGFTGSDQPGAYVSNVQYYDETVADAKKNGWTSISGISASLESGKGYSLYPLTDDDRNGTVESSERYPKLIDSDVDPISQATFDYTQDDGSAVTGGGPGISVTDNGPDTQDGNGTVDADEGWNLLGNPYLATVQWCDMTRSNLQTTAWIRDPQNGTDLKWNCSMGTGDDAFGGRIAPQQGFWVKGGGGSLSSVDLVIDIVTDQVDTTDVFFKSAPEQKPPVVRFDVDYEDRTRSAYVGFVEGSKTGMDHADTHEFEPDTTAPDFTLFTPLEDGTALDMTALPRSLSEKVVVPMDVMTVGCTADGAAFGGGEATLTWPQMRNIPFGWGLVLEDTKTGERIDLRSASRRTFTLSTSDQSCTSSSSATSNLDRPTQPDVLTLSPSKAGDSPRFKLHVNPEANSAAELEGLSGSAEGKEVVLTWATTRETNNEGFEVQHKFGSTGSFEPMTFVDGAGTSEKTEEYQFRTEELEAGTHIFRLKQVGADGSTVFTDPVSVDVGLSAEFKLSTYPNPVQQQATVEFAVKEEGPVTIALYNTLGQRVKTLYDSTPAAEQTRRLQLETDNLSSGLYFLRMKGAGIAATRQISIVH